MSTSTEDSSLVAQYRGEITVCRMCKNSSLPSALRTFCKWCQSRGYVAACLRCSGTGLIGGGDVWGGKSDYRSTCPTCGGLKMLPADPIVTPEPELLPPPVIPPEVFGTLNALNKQAEAATGSGAPLDVSKIIANEARKASDTPPLAPS